MTATAPLYAQATDTLRRRIAAKGWLPGERLPSEQTLCRELGVSSITMRRALATLAAEGMLVRLQGRGTFVSTDGTLVVGPPTLTSWTQEMTRRGWHSASRVLSLTTAPASEEVAHKLGIRPGAPTVVARRVRLADEVPIAIQTTWLPSLLFPDLDRISLVNRSLYDVLEHQFGARPARAVETYQAATVNEDEAPILQVPEGSPAFRVERITSDANGRRIEVADSVVRGDRYTLIVRLSAAHPRAVQRPDHA